MHAHTLPPSTPATAGSRPVLLPFFDEEASPGGHDMLLLNARPDLLGDGEQDLFRRLALLDLLG